nr:MAG TPA: hypothetical protein [Bacteriophage sp.]
MTRLQTHEFYMILLKMILSLAVVSLPTCL